MKHHLKAYEIAGALFVILAGTLLHFVYEWTGGNPLVGLIAPVNESTWEHLKLLFTPMLVYTIFEYFAVGREYQNFLTAKALGLLAGLCTIVFLFYTYTGVIGFNTLALDIITFILGVICAFVVSYFLTISPRRLPSSLIGAALFVVMLILFAYFTSNPPGIPLFKDPTA